MVPVRSEAGLGVEVPREGMLATVRKRRGLIVGVEPYNDSRGEVTHLVQVEYLDHDGGLGDTVIWEREPGTKLVEPKALPRINDEAPMRPVDFDAVQRAARWIALSPYLERGAGVRSHSSAIASPLFGAIQVEDFQLVPLVRALSMPRVSMLLADDVGLGKTIEAGLILNELILRRRIRRVLVLSPAWLRFQWREEMKSKFNLTFDIIDRGETHALRKRLGMDANPWRSYPRVIASYHYLKQPDVLEQFLAACQRDARPSANLPWDLLIVDEAHNCMPSSSSANSELADMITRIGQFFEHKVFLTATPHNGYTISFTGMLEQLDPVRFTQKHDMTAAERKRADEIVIRRLKSEVNRKDAAARRTPRFPERKIQPPRMLNLSLEEEALIRAFEQFRKAVREMFARRSRSEQMAAYFAIEVLNKRLLSCPFAFADSWLRFKDGLAHDERANEGEVRAAERSLQDEIDDDSEMESRRGHASRIAGAWLRDQAQVLHPIIQQVDKALELLGLTRDGSGELQFPCEDARFHNLKLLVEEQLRDNRQWRDDERLIVFTEYKTTLDYLQRRLLEEYKDPSRVLVLYGGMDDREREEIKRAFNDPASSVRILIGTDAASEGQNLQETARLLLHWDIPWNPSRLDQRNGRLDRHGQARDVHIHHFSSDGDADLRFLGKVLVKVDQIREDLGSMSELFEAAFERRFKFQQDANDLFASIEAGVEQTRRKKKADVPMTAVAGEEEQKALDWLVRELDFNPDSLRQTLEVALGMDTGGGFQFERHNGHFVFSNPRDISAGWTSIIDDEVRLPSADGATGRMPGLVFDPRSYLREIGGRQVFRPARDSVLLHLGHPLVRQALKSFSKVRYPGGGDRDVPASRWLIRPADLPQGVDALVLITVEEMATNELRETFHHWVRTLRFPIRQGHLGEPLDHLPAAEDRADDAVPAPAAVERVRELWLEVQADAEAALARHADQLTEQAQAHMKKDLAEQTKNQRQLFEARRRELDKELKKSQKQAIADFDKELDNQPDLFNTTHIERTADRIRDKVDSLRRQHQQAVEFLDNEEPRVLEHVLPRRCTLRGSVQVFPVTVEIRLPRRLFEGAR